MKTPTATLESLAKVIRSKNAGPFELTFDIMFDDAGKYERVKRSGAINAHAIAAIYRVRVDDVLVCRAYDPAVAFKITIRRPVGSGDITDRDVVATVDGQLALTVVRWPSMTRGRLAGHIDKIVAKADADAVRRRTERRAERRPPPRPPRPAPPAPLQRA